MKAIVHHKYGTPGVLELHGIDKPVVADDELLVRIRASSLNIGEWFAITGLYSGRMAMGMRKPKDPRLG